ncbi:MAG: FAD-binding oxidoreductase [Tepidisphaeraceae bacterium]|jgi:FAD/FMN-containing dehydrogenase
MGIQPPQKYHDRCLERPLAGWSNYLPQVSRVYRPESQAAARQLLSDGREASWIARGLGRGYGDCAVNGGGGVVLQTRLARMLEFDVEAGVLRCEAGVSLREIIDVVRPRSWMLPVIPGTAFVTVGGAVAADIHGKNHHRDGTFSDFVVALELLTASGEVLRCSREENAEIFWATAGGMGLTGIILRATLRLVKAPSAYATVTWQRADCLDKVLELMAAGDDRFTYSVAWIDCLAGGASLGRSVLMQGRVSQVDELPAELRDRPLVLPVRRRKTVPSWFPSFMLNRTTVRLFNAMYYRRHGDRTGVIDQDAFFHPLDAIDHWNRMYGKHGFVQYQSVIPLAGARQGLIEQLEIISASGRASFLAVLKAFGRQGSGMLSFPMPGLTLAIDLPNRPGLQEVLAKLDEVVLRHRGRLYLAKDACMSPRSFAAMYPRLGEFRAVKRRVDPENRFGSSQSRRLGIMDGEGK